MILSFTCVNPTQDQFHGKQMRVHNPIKPVANTPYYRCTVCLKERAGKK